MLKKAFKILLIAILILSVQVGNLSGPVKANHEGSTKPEYTVVEKGNDIYMDIELLPDGSFIPSNVIKGNDIYLDIELLPNGSFVPSNVIKGNDIYLNNIELLPDGSFNIL